MKNMIKPSIEGSYIERHRDVVSSKRDCSLRSRLEIIEDEVSKRYDAFEIAVENLNLFDFESSNVFLEFKDDLLKCYSDRTSKVKDIFDLIKKSQNARTYSKCPYCGTTLHNTHDHYLPEAEFPELALHALNLVPCCGTCNSIKNNKWKDDCNRSFIYLYGDSIPAEQYIYARIKMIEGEVVPGVTFYLEKPEGFPDNKWCIIENHYKHLRLLKRFEELSSNELSEIKDNCKDYLNASGSDVMAFIKSMLQTTSLNFGINNFKSVILTALIEDGRFIDNLGEY